MTKMAAHVSGSRKFGKLGLNWSEVEVSGEIYDSSTKYEDL